MEQAPLGSGGVTSLEVFKNQADVALHDRVLMGCVLLKVGLDDLEDLLQPL